MLSVGVFADGCLAAAPCAQARARVVAPSVLLLLLLWSVALSPVTVDLSLMRLASSHTMARRSMAMASMAPTWLYTNMLDSSIAREKICALCWAPCRPAQQHAQEACHATRLLGAPRVTCMCCLSASRTLGAFLLLLGVACHPWPLTRRRRGDSHCPPGQQHPHPHSPSGSTDRGQQHEHQESK